MKKTKNKKHEQIDETYEIDYDLFTVEEIIKIINFYNLIHQFVHNKVKKDKIKSAYYEYKNIINNISLEKKYNKSFYNKTGISIYQIIKTIN